MNEEQQLVNQFKKLPEQLQEAIKSSELELKIQEIGRKYSFNIYQVGELIDEVTLVMLGIVHPDDLVEDVEFRLEVTRLDAKEVVHDINENIFKPIREVLMEVHAEGGAETAEDEENLDREQVMREIHEHLEDTDEQLIVNDSQQLTKVQKPILPTTPPGMPVILPAPASIVEKKLTETVKIPKEETVIDRTKNRYGGQDPYREPIE